MYTRDKTNISQSKSVRNVNSKMAQNIQRDTQSTKKLQSPSGIQPSHSSKEKQIWISVKEGGKGFGVRLKKKKRSCGSL